MQGPAPPAHLRLLFLTDCPITASGGSERFLRNLVTGLAQQYFAISVVQLCDKPEQSARVHETAIPEAVELRYMPCHRVYGSEGMRVIRKLRRWVQREGFHIVQSQHETSDVVNALLPRGPLHAARISNRRDTGFLKSPRLKFASRLLNHRYDRIVAPTRAILDAVSTSEHAPRERMVCIPNGVDSARFNPEAGSRRQQLRAAMGVAPDALLVGCVADLFAVKRHVDLIDAIARVRVDLPGVHLVLIGDGPLRDMIQAHANRRNVASGVHMLGSRRDVDALLPALDLFVLASETEGLSNAILEAQACGLPVIATHVGGNADLVDADCGKLVPSRDPIALADAIAILLRDPDTRAHMGAAGRARVVARHSLEAMTGAYAALYREYAHVP